MTNQLFYQFVQLDLIQFETFVQTIHEDKEISMELSSSFRFDYNFALHRVCCTTTVAVNQENTPVLSAELNAYFQIQEVSESSITESDCVVLPIGLMAQFASLGYGTMRGIIYAKTMGTPLDKIVLPPNDVQKLFTTPARFKRSE
jgi:hypothetical protein